MKNPKVRTAICKTFLSEGDEITPVECRFHDQDGYKTFAEVKQQLYRDHPELELDGWVIDPSDKESMALNFLSPNVFQVQCWVETECGFEKKTFTRKEV
jgi:hypothetical protein